MAGRYGNDRLNSLCMWLYFVLIVLNIFIRSKIISVVVFLLFVIIIFRMFSKKIYSRQKENRIYLSFLASVKRKYSLARDMIKSRKTSIYRKCPHCGAVLKLPRRKGNHTVICPLCRKNFKVKCRG